MLDRVCPDCNGNGYVWLDAHQTDTCQRCGGSGIIQDQPVPHKDEE